MDTIKDMEWRVNTVGLFKEVLENPGAGILHKPILIMLSLLEKVAKRAIELDDKELNKLMIRLTLYDRADPESENYDEKFIREYLES